MWSQEELDMLLVCISNSFQRIYKTGTVSTPFLKAILETNSVSALFLFLAKELLSREPRFPTWRKGTSSSNVPLNGDMLAPGHVFLPCAETTAHQFQFINFISLAKMAGISWLSISISEQGKWQYITPKLN